MKLFVYGTLKRGYWNNRYLSTSTFIDEHILFDYALVDLGGIPGLIETDHPDGVKGEVWEVPDDAIPALDRLEGHPEHYTRQKIGSYWTKRPDFARVEPLFGYVYQERRLPRVETNALGHYEWESDI